MEDPPSVNAAEPPDRETEPGWRIRNILAPTDFSASSLEAVAQAAALARQYDATLTVLHVIDSNPPAAFTHCGPVEDLMRQLWITGISELSRLTEALAQDQTKSQTLIVEGIPAEGINESSSGFDLLVISPQRSKPAWHFFSRHTARRVIEQAQCPVLVMQQETGPMHHKLESKATAAV
jgi:nucleotide-binding universal stress UspA family protein